MSDYFSSVTAVNDSANLSCRGIEDGLADVVANIGSYACQVERCVGILLQRFVYTDSDRCSPKATSLALGILKVFGRQMSDGGEIATQRAISGLLKLANMSYLSSENDSSMSYASDICSDALTCVANAMLLKPECRAYAAEHQCIDTIVDIMGAAGNDSTLLQDVLGQTANTFLNHDDVSTSGKFSSQQVLTEILKAAMGLCGYALKWIHTDKISSEKKLVLDDSFPPDKAVDFILLLKVALDTLDKAPLEDHHLASSTKQAVAIVMNFSTIEPQAIRDIWLPRDHMWKHVDTIFGLFKDIVYHVVDTFSDDNNLPSVIADTYQAELTPLMLVLVRLVSEHPDVREHLFYKVYPKDAIDFAVLPENRPGMAAKLVRLMRSPDSGPFSVSTITGDLLLALLGNDIRQFILTVGYGNAAGYMVARHIEIPADIIEQVRESSSESGAVNPVTGRYWSQEDTNQELANMTDEEKEREAERLFVLFERLNKTGIIKTANPVCAAAESGRFEELDDCD
ncbi:hypothetical protein EV180_005377 [Coemansia sp. RSA 518]|nr:hypothetical protein EV181_005108 [Coemansia sp. RSA 532]KAJ2219399.1 hypothetical protein EV180_005377 [Coemansia sp. RSA 518]